MNLRLIFAVGIFTPVDMQFSTKANRLISVSNKFLDHIQTVRCLTWKNLRDRGNLKQHDLSPQEHRSNGRQDQHYVAEKNQRYALHSSAWTMHVTIWTKLYTLSGDPVPYIMKKSENDYSQRCVPRVFTSPAVY